MDMVCGAWRPLSAHTPYLATDAPSGTRRSAITKYNYVTVGRTALLRSRDTAGGRDALDLHLGGFSGWQNALRVHNLTLGNLNQPEVHHLPSLTM